MNWYTTQKIAQAKLAMPLPPADNYPEKGPFGYNGGMADLDYRMSEDDANQVAQQHPNLRYLGHGVDGVAYTHNNPNTVIKITNSPNEAMYAEQLVGRNLPCCANVLSVNMRENARGETWTIEVEKLQPLTPEQRNQVHQMKAGLAFKGDPFANAYRKMLQCLKRNGLPTDDAHSSNIGFKANGQLALFDFGPSSEYRTTVENE